MRYAVVGHPVDHSRSPAIHNRWFAAAGLPHRYGRVDTGDHLQDGAALLAHLDTLGLWGANLTVPVKRLVLDRVDADPLAVAVGAVNTLVRSEDRWRGHNTDVDGFARALAAHDHRVDHALILGAGGAARAVAVALAPNTRVAVMNRTPRPELGEVAPWGDRSAFSDVDLVVNALPGGAQAAVAALDIGALAPGALWMDLNYWNNAPPHRDQLLRAGHRFDDGAAMLIHQAARAFELFTGSTPDPSIVAECMR